MISNIEPFFVYAWVLITEDEETTIHEQISHLLAEEKLSSSTELSSKKLWQESRGSNVYVGIKLGRLELKGKLDFS